MRGNTSFWLILLSISGFYSCEVSPRYDRLVEKELASGIRNDSIFWGIHLGMTAKDFYARCWELNEQKLIKQGATNTTVEYPMTELDFPAYMEFYPEFFEGKILEMPLKFAYSAWAPWNKRLSGDSLISEIKPLLENWYGQGFMDLKTPQGNPIWVKVDGNRRITLRNMGNYAEVKITDLVALHKKRSIEQN